MRSQCIDTSRWKYRGPAPLVPGNTPTKRFPIFSLRKRIYPSAAACLSPGPGREMRTCRAPSLRHPIISHDLIFATRNTKLAFHLRELQFATSARARHLRRSVLFPFIRFLSSPSRVIRFLSAEPPFGYFPICPHRPWTISTLLHFRVFVRPPFSPTVKRIDVAFCPASNEVSRGAPWVKSR